MSMRHLSLAVAAVLSLAACRKDDIEVRRVPKEAPPQMAAGMPASASSQGEVEAPPKAGGLRWQTPSGWKELGGDGMRVATFQPPQTDGKIEGTIVALPGDAGGELANVNRWRGQVALPPVSEAELGALRVVVRAPVGEIAVYDFTSADTVKTRLLAGTVKIDGTTWFFKLTGAAKAVEAARPAFTGMLGRLSRDG